MEFNILSADERKKSRERIEQALCLNLPEQAVIIQAPSNIQKQTGKLREDMKNASVGTKLNSFVRNAFSIKNETEMLLDAKLRKLKDAIQAGKTVYTNFANSTLSADLATVLYEIYRFSEFLRPAITSLFADPGGLEKVVSCFLGRRIPQAKVSLEDFISVDEMKALFFQTESQLDLAAEINRRLQEYCQNLPIAEIDQCAEGIVPLFYFRSLVAFPFSVLFSEFQYKANDAGGDPSFQSANLVPALTMIENLYCHLHPLKKLDPETPVYPEILELASRHAAGELLEDAADGTEISEKTNSLLANIKNMMTVTQRLLTSVPLVELIRYYKNDPYYKLMVYPPRLKLAEFYTISLRVKILEEAEFHFPELYQKIFRDVVNELFGGEPDVFDFFMNSGLGMTPRKGYASFTHPQSLKILYAFIKTHYFGYIQGFVHALNKVMTHRIRTNFSQLLEYSGGLEGVATRLRAFDQSFSPDAEDGKTFARLKFVLDKDLTQQKYYIALMTKKNDEAKTLLDTGVNFMQGMHTSLSAISREAAFVSAASSLISGIEKTLSRSTHALFTVLKLIRYTTAMEKGIF